MDKTVRQLYWDKDTLVVELECGEVYSLEGAYIRNIDFNYESEVCQIEDVEISYEPVTVEQYWSQFHGEIK